MSKSTRVHAAVGGLSTSTGDSSSSSSSTSLSSFPSATAFNSILRLSEMTNEIGFLCTVMTTPVPLDMGSDVMENYFNFIYNKNPVCEAIMTATSLDASNCMSILGSAGFDVVLRAAAGAPNLHTLNINSNQLGELGKYAAPMLEILSESDSLRIISVNSNHLGKYGPPVATSLAKLSSLSSLDIMDNNLEEYSLPTVKALTTSHSVRSVNMIFNDSIAQGSFGSDCSYGPAIAAVFEAYNRSIELQELLHFLPGKLSSEDYSLVELVREYAGISGSIKYSVDGWWPNNPAAILSYECWPDDVPAVDTMGPAGDATGWFAEYC